MTAPQPIVPLRKAAAAEFPLQKINLMTARYAPGDAIGNYLDVLRGLLRAEFAVDVFADGSADDRRMILPARAYVPTQRDLLWFQYSLYSENFQLLKDGPDKKILDYHGVCPPRFYSGYSREHFAAAREGERLLPAYRGLFELAIAHSEFTANELRRHGYRRVVRLPLVAPGDLLHCTADAELGAKLAQAEYLLFVGRLVPQKNILGMLDFFAALLERRPALQLILIGSAANTPGYLREIVARIERPPLRRRVWLLGPVRRPELLKAFYQHARFLLLLSHWESFCAPVVEALCCGTPTIGRNAAALAETISETGVLVEPEDPAPALERVTQLLDDREAGRQLRERCRERARLFTPKALALQLRELLEQLGCRR